MSTNTTHEHDGVTVSDYEVPVEHNEHGETWCATCGERIVVPRLTLTPEEQAAEDYAVDHGISYRDSM